MDFEVDGSVGGGARLRLETMEESKTAELVEAWMAKLFGDARHTRNDTPIGAAA
jgi:hypothetical protein